MSTSGDVERDADEVLVAAREGDGAAFEALVAPRLGALHAYCYRMLGSHTDAEDALQETLLHAWRGLGEHEVGAPLAQWLYRITTTTCLKLIRRRTREPARPGAVPWLQPYPDALLNAITDSDEDPAAVPERRDSVGLAFIAALQSVPPTPRAVLILRDVLGWPGREVAELLGLTAPGIADELESARAILVGLPGGGGGSPASGREQRVVDTFQHAWAGGDGAALAATLRADVVLSQPATGRRTAGREEMLRFLTAVPADDRLDLVRLTAIRANGQPAVAVYQPDPEFGGCAYTILVLTVAEDAVAAVASFDDPELFPVFDLPVTVA